MTEDPRDLRARAVELYAMALKIRDDAPAHASVLIEEAIDLEEKAKEMVARETPAKPGKVPG